MLKSRRSAVLNFCEQIGPETIELKGNELDLVTGGYQNRNGDYHPIADGILLGLIKAGAYK